jgi:catechol 2,3-dioxygenase-like lactoylglutathione lyase family enzyme
VTPIGECLLASPGADKGFIRLFRVPESSAAPIRDGASTWDSGGIFDLDIRVPEVRPFARLLQDQGWRGVSEPVDWPFGDLLVREWLTTGPDAVVLALIQRLAPPLEDFELQQGFSLVFNSSQIVRDMPRALDFYGKLGFQTVLRHRGPLGGPGGEVLGLSPEEAPETAVDLVILHPAGTMDGSVELVAFEDRPGRDLSERAHPARPGLNLLRFPVRGLGDYAAVVAEAGIEAATAITELTVEPFGRTKLFAVRSPDGAWLEFYEAI